MLTYLTLFSLILAIFALGFVAGSLYISKHIHYVVDKAIRHTFKYIEKMINEVRNENQE